jgi:hypothetical protein
VDSTLTQRPRARPAPDSAPVARASLDFRWEREIGSVAKAWAECLGEDNVLRSYALQQAAEAARLDDVELHYLVGEDAQGVACVVTCFSFKVSLVSVASPTLQRLVGWVRKLFPKFLYVRLFTVGSPISTCGDLLGLKAGTDAARWNPDKISRLFDEIIRKAGSIGIKFILVKELEAPLADLLRRSLPRFVFVESLPTTYLDLAPREQGGYLGSIRSRYRNKLKKRKSIGAQNHLTWEVAATCRGYEEDIHRLYLQVLEKSPFVFERLNKDFFTQADRTLGENSFFLLGFRLADGVKRLVACELIVCDRTTMHPLYSGFDYWVKRDSSLYFNAFYAVIEEAERRGFSRVHLGQTAYEVKAELGATCTPLFIGIHHTNRLFQRALWMGRRWLVPPSSFPLRDVFATPPTGGRPPPRSAGERADCI